VATDRRVRCIPDRKPRGAARRLADGVAQPQQGAVGWSVSIWDEAQHVDLSQDALGERAFDRRQLDGGADVEDDVLAEATGEGEQRLHRRDFPGTADFFFCPAMSSSQFMSSINSFFVRSRRR